MRCQKLPGVRLNAVLVSKVNNALCNGYGPNGPDVDIKKCSDNYALCVCVQTHSIRAGQRCCLVCGSSRVCVCERIRITGFIRVFPSRRLLTDSGDGRRALELQA